MKNLTHGTWYRLSCFVIATFLIIISCSKDVDTLRSAVLNENNPSIDGSLSEEPMETDTISPKDEAPIEKQIEYEIRTVVFPPVNDAFLQNGVGHNDSIVRLEEGRRTSYLMFDLSPIDSLEGNIVAASLEFTINTDDGEGEILVYEGLNNDWNEIDLSLESAPETGVQLGEVNQDYRINSTVLIELDTLGIPSSKTSLVLDHKGGDDLAFASKESNKGGSHLIIQYEVPVGTEEIEIPEPVQNTDQAVEPTDDEVSEPQENGVVETDSEIPDTTDQEEPTNQEEPVIEEPAAEEPDEENPAPEEPETEDPIEEEPIEEEPIEEEPVTEEPVTEEPIEEEPVTEEPVIEEPAEDEPVTEEPVTEEPIEEEPIEEEPDTEPVIEDPVVEEPIEEEPSPALPPTNDSPNAVASASPTKGVLPLKVVFNGGNSSDDKAVVSYAWSFGDGGTSSSKNPEHTFSEEGSYEAKLVVKDAEGLTSSGSVTIIISAPSNEAPIAKISTSTSSGLVPLEVKFTGSASTDDKSIKSYAWNFKDGNSSNASNPTHTFTEAGSYSVELTVTDEQGLTDKETVTISVTEPENEAPNAKISANVSSGQVPLEIKFTGSESTDDNSVKSYAWNFKDGQTSTVSNPTHTFDKSGTFAVELKVSDEQGLSDTETITIKVNEPENEAPISRPKVNTTSGSAPFEVQFDAEDSTDDHGISSYFWDFKDGSTSNTANPSHTFETPGTYIVALTVADEDGLTSTKTVSVVVNPAANEAPNAQFSASKLTGEAPLKVDFNGSASTDDKGIVNYSWSIDGRNLSGSNTSYTFNNSGPYNVVLTVIDQEGLSSSQSIDITVTDPVTMSQIPCSVGGGYANDTGEKIWCWNNVSIPNYSNTDGYNFSNNELKISSECYERQVTKEGNRIKFKVSPQSPTPGSWCNNNYNMRAEISTLPWKVNHPKGTEEWMGWSYTFGSNYKIDEKVQWLFYQAHEGTNGQNPLIAFWVINDGGAGSKVPGEIHVVNSTESKNKYYSTGIIPRAGQTVDIVVHVVWGDNNDGLLQVWMNGNKVHDKKERTVRASNPVGGNPKWGIYKWPWREKSFVDQSAANGINTLETYMGTLRMITRRPGDADYGKDAYSAVAP
ncbi:PKD repeat protein [Flavobacteriaceae bacterium MAR_2009_75]|nr:PKD repeat protein [Flavobacteriaceae bacterium MAR_2009_75]